MFVWCVCFNLSILHINLLLIFIFHICRFNIMTEIMQATTIDKLKKSKSEGRTSPNYEFCYFLKGECTCIGISIIEPLF